MSADQQVPPPQKKNRHGHWMLAAVLLVAAVARAAALWRYGSNLSDDRDAYLALGRSLAEGRGFVDPASGRPTAYRPPLYPIVISILFRCGGGTSVLGVAQAVFGVGTVALTWMLTSRLGLGRKAWIAAGIVAVDPLLAYYTTWPMTETLFTLLSTSLLASMQGAADDRSADGQAESLWPKCLVGALFGLCALCRPTVWAFGAFVVAWETMSAIRKGGIAALGPHSVWHRHGVAVATALAVVTPWGVRNYAQFGKPILTTTHGGYTLLLANNPVVYEQEVRRPWGTVWEDAPAGQRQSDWLADVESEMSSGLGVNATEMARDRWMSARAVAAIRDEPATFLRACWLRVRRLWNVVPLSPAGGNLPRGLLWAVGSFYATISLLAIAGLIRSRGAGFQHLVLLIASVTLVHSVYWSNARMRAPLMPAVAVLAAAVVARPREGQGIDPSQIDR